MARRSTRERFKVEPGRLGPELHDEIRALAAKGWSSSRIALQIRRHPATVAWFMYRDGLKAIDTQRARRPYLRQGMPVRPYGAEEDAFITALRVQGCSLVAIASQAEARFGHQRTRHSIRVRLILLSTVDDAA